MSLERGTKIAHYEILGLLGRGGMGEVYRASDTKLNRDVAVKLLPEQFTTDVDRMERFQREARVLASMNHSNIAAIYGLEESKPLQALIMELVAGPTLADRFAQGPIPTDVRPFPGPGGKWQISTAGGVLPTWSKNGKEIFFEAFDKKIMVVNYKVEGDSFQAGKPQVWSEATIASAGSVRDFDIHPDGQRFAILKAADSQAQKLDKVMFVFNFADELRKITPAK